MNPLESGGQSIGERRLISGDAPPAPGALMRSYPLFEKTQRFIAEARQDIRNILNCSDRRLFRVFFLSESLSRRTIQWENRAREMDRLFESHVGGFRPTSEAC